MTKKSIWTLDELFLEIKEARAELTVSDILTGDRASMHMQLSYDKLPSDMQSLEAYLLGAANERLILLSKLCVSTLKQQDLKLII